MYSRNDHIINNVWSQVENGRHTLEEYQRYTAHTPEQFLMDEIGEPTFIESISNFYII